MNWLWWNIPLEAVFFLAMTGIPLWMVIRHPDSRPVPAEAVGRGVVLESATIEDMCASDVLTRPSLEVIYDGA